MRTIITATLLLLLTACGGNQGVEMNTEIQRGPMPDGGQWAGIWFTNWGEMSLTKTGSSVVGEFCQEERNRYGRVEGTAQGDVMTLHWLTYDVSMTGAMRESEGSAIVQFSYIPAGENQTSHFEGTWGYENSNADGGILRGDRSPRRSSRFLRSDYTVNCPMREQAEAPPPLSTEPVGDNPEPEEEDLDFGGDDEEGSVLDDI